MDSSMEDAQDPSSPVPAAKKMRRLRKFRETEIQENDEPFGEVGVVSEVRVGQQRETAEEILKRFGKGEGDDGGKKRKSVQKTIFAAVVDMSKQTEVVVAVEEVEGEPPAVVDNVEAEDGGLELPSHGEELDVGSEEIAPLSKKKRSNTVKRCSAHVTGITFDSASLEEKGEAMDGIENETDDGVKDIDQEGSDAENGNEGKEDGSGASDSEKGNEGNDGSGAGGLNAGVNAGWSEEGWAEEEMSMDSILEKARKMVAAVSNPGAASAKPTKEKRKTSEEDLTGIDDQNGKKKKGKKEEERIKREEIYAESQRLLRESKGVSFVAPAPVMKPVSSLLEKIRQRRLQLGCSGTGIASSQEFETKSVSRRERKERSSTHVDLTVDGDTEVEIEVFSSTVVKTEEVKTEETAVDVEVHNKPTQEVSRDMEDVETGEADGNSQDDTACEKEILDTPQGQKDLIRDDLGSSRSDRKGLRLEPSQCIMDTQDLLCTSQLSAATEESLEAIPFESVGTTVTDSMGLDTQLLDEYLMPRPMRHDHHEENKETGTRPSGQSEVYTTAAHVRGLIDDEAEDEDEDILAENAEEEVVGDEEDLRDLIATTEKEKAGDKARRDALHRKWLDQQDTEQTEDILERLRTGRSTRWKGRDRVVSCLDEDDDLVNTRDSESLDKNCLSSQAGADEPPAEEDLIDEPAISLRQRMRSQELEMDCLLDEYEDTEDVGREEPVIEDEIIEDEEEHEQSIIRQRMLEESEEQLVFLSPADDESSREVLSLITKVNVGNLKAKSTTGHSEIRAAPSSALPSRPSFLGRSSSSSSLPPPAQRHVGSGGSSRSFVFGRDDSNSAHGFPSNKSQEEKQPGVSKSVSDKGFSSTSTIGGKKRPTPPTRGPSLFEMLKKQSKELEQNLKNNTSAIAKKWGSDTEAFSMFAPKKSVTPSRHKL